MFVSCWASNMILDSQPASVKRFVVSCGGGKSDESLDFSVIEWSRICWPHRGDLTWYPTVGDYAESLPH